MQEDIQISVQSEELNRLIAQLQEAERASEEAARAMNNLGDEANQAGDSMDKAGDDAEGFSISGTKAAIAGAAMGVAMKVVEKAMEMAGVAVAAINETTVSYIRTTERGRNSLDSYTDALERSKHQIAIAIVYNFHTYFLQC
jgi:phage-related minor tail protein